MKRNIEMEMKAGQRRRLRRSRVEAMKKRRCIISITTLKSSMRLLGSRSSRASRDQEGLDWMRTRQPSSSVQSLFMKNHKLLRSQTINLIRGWMRWQMMLIRNRKIQRLSSALTTMPTRKLSVIRSPRSHAWEAKDLALRVSNNPLHKKFQSKSKRLEKSPKTKLRNFKLQWMIRNPSHQ